MAHSGQPGWVSRRRAIIDVLTRRGFTPWEAVVEAVETEVEPGVFGASPHTRLWADMRALRDAGISIGYSRAKGTKGYFLRADSLDERKRTAIEQVFRELDFEHLDRVAQAAPGRRVEAVFEMIDFAHEVSEAGRRDREQNE